MRRSIVFPQQEDTFHAAIQGVQLQQQPRQELMSDSVRVQTISSALNFFDLLQACGQYQMKRPFPLVAGAEGVGIVTEVSADATRPIRVGSLVIFNSFMGTLSSDLVLPTVSCVALGTASELLSRVDPLSLSGIWVGFSTAFHGIVQRGKASAGEVIVITGASGGMGTIAIQLAKSLGLVVVAACSTEAKANFCVQQVGAHYGVTYDKLRSFVKANFSGGVDLVYEIVGGDVFLSTLRIMAPEGRLLIIGFADSIPKMKTNMPLIKGYSIVGVRSGAEMMRVPRLLAEMQEALVRGVQDGTIKPLYESFSSENAAEAFARIADRKARGKVVIDWRQQSKL